MICGDLDLERARRDDAYRCLVQAFLVLGTHTPLTALGFPELPRHDFTLHRLATGDDERDRRANAR